MVQLSCRQCGVEFEYAKKEVTRQAKLGRKSTELYCSCSCGRSWKNAHIPEDEKRRRAAKQSKRMKGSTRALKHKHGFGFTLTKARRREGAFNLTDKILHDLWEKQKGLCALTKVPMIHPRDHKHKSPTMASLDRIDSNKGYIVGNVQFVCYSINMAKSNFTEEVFVDFLEMLML